MTKVLSNRSLLNWQTFIYILFVGLNFLGIAISILVFLVNSGVISMNYLNIIGWVGRIYSEYIYSSHQLLNLVSIVLLLILMFRLNINLRNTNIANSSNRFLIAIHFILPIFDSIFRYLFFSYIII